MPIKMLYTNKYNYKMNLKLKYAVYSTLKVKHFTQRDMLVGSCSQGRSLHTSKKDHAGNTSRLVLTASPTTQPPSHTVKLVYNLD